MTVQDIIDKRKARWNEKHDLDYDEKLINAAAVEILSKKELRDEILEKPYLLIPCCFYIVDKKRETVPFFFNPVQEDFIRQLETKGTSKPFFVLKGRQQGFTSVITAIQLAFAIVRKNFSGFTMADRTDNTMAIFNDKARVVYDRLPAVLKPHEKFNSRNEMFFDKLNSSWRIATATDQVGRSRTLNFVHFSEVAFYEADLASLQAGIGEAITADAIQVYETTANGFNQAKDLWDGGENGDRVRNKLIECVRDCARFDIPVMVIHPFIGFQDHTPTQVGLDNYARIIDVANKLGVKLGFENVEGEEYLAAIMERFWDEPSLGFCLDTGHEMCYNEHRDMLALYGEKLVHTHFNDNLGVRGDEITFLDDIHLMPTDGIADWHGIMQRIQKTGYNGILMSELSYSNQPGKDGVIHEYTKLSPEEFAIEAYQKVCLAVSS